MKKALLVLLVLAAIGSLAFADVKVSGLVLTGFKAGITNVGTPVVSSNYIKLYEGFRGFSTVATVNVGISAGDGNFGYDGRIRDLYDVDPNPIFDQASGYWKMFNGMAVATVGILIPNSFATPEMAWGDSQFNGAGFNLTLKPIEGLEIAYEVPLATDNIGTEVKTALGNSKIGLAYTMKDMFAFTGAFLMSNTANQSDAYFGLSINAVKDLGFWVEGLLKNFGDTTAPNAVLGTGGESDFYVELSYPVAGIGLGLWGEYDMVAAAGNTAGWVVGPNVSYPIMDKVTLSGEFDIGNNDNLGGWYGQTTLGAGDPLNKLSWAGFVTCDYASPAGKIRARALYQSKVNGDSAMYFRLEYRYLF
jgi:hypothetical protein